MATTTTPVTLNLCHEPGECECCDTARFEFVANNRLPRCTVAERQFLDSLTNLLPHLLRKGSA